MGRDLRELEEWLRPWAELLVQVGRAELGFDVRVTSVRRDRDKQAELRRRWERGQSPFPAAKAGCSIHEHGLAFDLSIPGPGGRPDLKKLAVLGRVWESWGGQWGGRWGRKDEVHFQPQGPARLC